MLPEQLPACLICSNKSFASGGGHFSPSLSQQWFKCDGCRADVQYIGMGGCAILGFNLTEAHQDYVNRILLSAWRMRNKQIDEARGVIIQARIDQVNQEMGLPPGTNGYTLLDEKAPQPERYKEWCERLRGFDQIDAVKEREAACAIPAVTPPRMPLDMIAYNGVQTLNGPRWDRLDPRDPKSANAETPADPIRVAHEQAFEQIFAEIERTTDFLCEAERIPNKYFDDKYDREPWFTFGVGSGQVVIGPRKRVISIQGKRPEAFDVRALRDVAKADGVTWYNADAWQGEPDTATTCEIHAWNREKAVQYLTLLIASLRAA